MKVVLFCGGQGTRRSGYPDAIPKPMVPLGYSAIRWHVMKYYAHFGHRDFILCLGYQGDVIKRYFLNYDECLSNDFVLTNGGRTVELHSRDIEDWKITFVDTGLHVNVGGRLKAVEPYVRDEEMFLANYADGLSDLSLPAYLDYVRARDAVASFLCVLPSQSFHVVSVNERGVVADIAHVSRTNTWINGGFFALTPGIFDVLGEGEELVEEPFQRLIARGRLVAYRYEGFWQCMDTFKDKQALEDLKARGNAPWEIWQRRPEARVRARPSDAVVHARRVVRTGTEGSTRVR